jgi:hypothetical protein
MPARHGSRILLWTLLALIVAGGIGFVALLTVPAPVEGWLQGRIVLALRQHYRSDVQLENPHVTLVPRVSQTMSGAKHWLLVPFDPLFMKHGAGTYLPVAIAGTREHPEVKLQLNKIF